MKKCVMCKSGNLEYKNITTTLKSGNMVLVFRNVPADVCGNCGEEYFEATVTSKLLAIAKETIKVGGVEVMVKSFDVAA